VTAIDLDSTRRVVQTYLKPRKVEMYEAFVDELKRISPRIYGDGTSRAKGDISNCFEKLRNPGN
jgi:hypothetical protein